jgi:hypothetical protein
MAAAAFGNGQGILISPRQTFPIANPGSPSTLTINAVGESASVIGNISLSSGPGTSKTFNNACQILYYTGAVTFGAGSTLRVGIQNGFGAAGLEDGTFDVYVDLVGGTDTITASVANGCTMSTGSLSITDGDKIALVIEMTALGGSDSVVLQRWNTGVVTGSPYGSDDTGTLAKNGLPLMAILVFADGTIGWWEPLPPTWFTNAIAAFGTSSNPDEYALGFSVPVPCTIYGWYIRGLGSVATTDDFTMQLYSDPTSPTSLLPGGTAISIDPDLLPAAPIDLWYKLATPINLSTGVTYLLSVRAATTNTITLVAIDTQSVLVDLRPATTLGTNWATYTRDGGSGAFSAADGTQLMHYALSLGNFDNGAGGGGGAAQLVNSGGLVG